ncbi:MAG: helix-turn-helix transcriptional regulator [Acidimicrobiales bacterium]|nr:helix-turn-helix transcriptional regulator [Acidimicrobiales bacterium]HRW38300.1 metalloregulator ArsR/SmtB family transcription factor [Aquihabitans sp.]
MSDAKASEAEVDPCCSGAPVAAIDEDDATQLASVFAALADPVRLRLYDLVCAAGEICSCDLQEPLGRSQPTISHHTKILADAGLITGEKRGRWVWWSAVPGRLAGATDALQAVRAR